MAKLNYEKKGWVALHTQNYSIWYAEAGGSQVGDLQSKAPSEQQHKNNSKLVEEIRMFPWTKR